MTCELCSHTEGDAPKRRCAFKELLSGVAVFSPDNYRCATLIALQSAAERYGKTLVSQECGQIWMLPHPQEGSWIVLTTAAIRDHVDIAIYLDDGVGYALPLSVAEEAIEYYRARTAAGDCEVLP